MDIWLLDMSGAPGPGGYPRKPLLASRFDERYPRISPNGRWLAYSSDESGVMNVYVAPFAQPGLKRSVSTGGGRFPVWSRDGRELYYVSKARSSRYLSRTATRFSWGLPPHSSKQE